MAGSSVPWRTDYSDGMAGERETTLSVEQPGRDLGAPARAEPPTEPQTDRPLVVIEPTKGWVPLNLRDVCRARELLYFLARRDVNVRYKQTAIGAAWAILQPLTLMVLFTVLFKRVVDISSEEE
jgi:homopolymeric O-antigen transport system permease protein